MNKLDVRYINLMNDIIMNGVKKENRTGTDTYSVTGRTLPHDMSEGFPVLTTKKVAFKTMAVELEGFIKGITDKAWYQERNCHIWDEWCNPESIPVVTENRKQLQLENMDLGPIYGYQWRGFNEPYMNIFSGYNNEGGYDQLERVMESLKNNPNDRRMLVSAWNPLQLHQQALPPCHVLWQVFTRGNKLDMIWYQRSVDVFLGLPFNIASYGLLLSLLAKQFDFEVGTLTGFFGDTHIYANHLEATGIQADRMPFSLPKLKIDESFKDIREFEHTMVSLLEYDHHPAIKAEVAI